MDCIRKIKVYGITDIDNNTKDKTSIFIGGQDLGENQACLNFDITSGNYYGIKIVFYSRTGTTTP